MDEEPKKKRSNSEGLSSSSSDEEPTNPASPSVVSVKIPLNRLPSAKMYEVLKALKLPNDSLLLNGYPRWNPINGVYFERTRNNKSDWIDNSDFRRRCCRCNKQIILNLDGTMTQKRCRYHFRPKWDPATNTKQLQCCFEAPGTSKGCRNKPSHVYTGAWADTLLDFVATPPSNGPNDFRSKKVYALDVEAVFTLNGLECGRVSLVDPSGAVILDTPVRPAYDVVDFNFEFSGLTSMHMAVGITLAECRQSLFQFINEDTLLIGHSLESDLKALRLVHSNVVDTSVIFSQIKKSGKTTKLSLKNLAAEHLGKEIQCGGAGHSSVEDAAICMELLSKYHDTVLVNDLENGD